MADLLTSWEGDFALVVNNPPRLTSAEPPARWSAEAFAWFCSKIRHDLSDASRELRNYLVQLLSDSNVPAAANPGFWDDFQIYEVEVACRLSAKSAREIRGMSDQGLLFSDGDTTLKKALHEACPGLVVWFVPGIRPPGIYAPAFDTAVVASLLLGHGTLGGVDARIALIARLLPAMPSTTKAVRYLIHGKFEHRNGDEPLYLKTHFEGEWNDIVNVALTHRGDSWCVLPDAYGGGINDNQKSQLKMRVCGADAFRELCRPAANDLALLRLEAHHDFLLNNLRPEAHLNAHADHDLLRRLKIHRHGENQYTTIVDGVWLAPEKGDIPPPALQSEWKELCRTARIVGRSDDPGIEARQKLLFKEAILDKDGIIKLACGQERPLRFAKLILHALSRGTPVKEAADALKSVAWLPVIDGAPAKVGQLLWMEGAEAAIELMMRHQPKDWPCVTRRMIAVDLANEANEKAWNTLKTFLPKGEDAITLLEQTFKSSSRLHLGIEKSVQVDRLGEVLEALEGVEDDASLAVHLVRALWTRVGHDVANAGALAERQAWAAKVAAVFSKEWSGKDAERYDTALEALRDRHGTADAITKQKVKNVFHAYLKAARKNGRWNEAYANDPDFFLLNQEGEWTSVAKLAVPIMGIARRALADADVVAALGFEGGAGVEDRLPGVAIDEAFNDQELASLLQQYGCHFSESLPGRLWGIFVALLGDSPAVRGLADQFTGRRTATIRDELCGPGGPGISPRNRVDACSYSCAVTDGETSEIAALNGEPFDAPLDMDQATFLVPQSDTDPAQWWRNRFFVDREKRGVRHHFQLCDPKAFRHSTDSQMRDRLARTIQQLLDEVFHVNGSHGSVRALIDKIAGLGQVSLGRAQQEILGTAQIHLSQLGVRPQPGSDLGTAIRCLDEATSLEAQAREEKENDMGDHNARELEARKSKDEGLQLLRSVLEQDNEVQWQLVEAMKSRIEREQYRPESVPFELFQNADDALAELGPDHSQQRVFVAEFEAIAARFAHWGRPINDPAGAEGDASRSRSRDLVKMLILHGSDKQVEDGGNLVTGKFGLGFKSVFLVTRQPLLLSKDLAFDLVGAIYPRPLNADCTARLQAWLHDQAPGQTGGTAIELPLETRVFDSRFRLLSPYLPVFAKQVREVRIIHGGVSRTYAWRPQLKHDEGPWALEVGSIDGAGSILRITARDVSWVFGMTEAGLAKLNSLPCLWITAPTQEADDLGFAVNGPFDPDPGRTKLGSGEAAELKNAALFLEASGALAEFLEWCHKLGDDLGRRLGDERIDPAGFWQSVWALFGALHTPKGDSQAKGRLTRAIWPAGCLGGYAGIVLHRRVIPNGMPGTLETLVSAETAAYQTSGFLESKQGNDFFAEAATWPEWLHMESELGATAEKMVCLSTGDALNRHLSATSVGLCPVAVPFVLNRLIGAMGRITPSLGARLGVHFSRQVFKREDDDEARYEWPLLEEDELRDCLGGFLFENQSGEWVEPDALLIPSAEGYEGLRAGLAPQERCLGSAYSATESLEFFRLCREEMKIDEGEVAGWISESVVVSDSVRIAAALRFLASDDDLAVESARRLASETRKALVESSPFLELLQEDQNRVRNRFREAKIRDADRDGVEYTEAATPYLDIIQGPDGERLLTIDEIVQAWDGHELEATNEFTVSGEFRELVFPGVAGGVDLGSLLRDVDSLAGKEHWYRLLCLGCSLSVPLGVSPTSRIIPFWRRRLDAEFWGATIPKTLAEAESSGFDQRLDAFFENVIHQSFRDANAGGEDADLWRRVFYDFRKMHFFVFRNHLPAELMRLVACSDVNGTQLVEFLRSGNVPLAMQEPGFERWTGVIGQSMSAPLLFVMRELRRLAVLPDDRFNRACYYMNSPARRIAFRLGWLDEKERRSYAFDNLVSLSNTVCDNMRNEADKLLPFLDLPLQWYALQNPK